MKKRETDKICIGKCSATEKMQAKEPPTNRNSNFCTTTDWAINHWRSERPTPSAEAKDHRPLKDDSEYCAPYD